MTILCPCCGQPTNADAVSVKALAEAPSLTPNEQRIVATLAGAFPRAVSLDAIIDALWGDDPNGGPDAPKPTLHVYFVRLRQRLRPHGWTISHTKYGVNASGRYRLERLAP